MQRAENGLIELLVSLLMTLKECLDYEATVRLILQFGMEDQIFFRCLLKSGSSLGPEHAQNLVIVLMNQSIIQQKYHICLKTWRIFKTDLIKMKKIPPIFDNFILQFKETDKYEAKIFLFGELTPIMKHFLVE